MTNRREFIVQLSLGTGVLAAGQAMAQGAALSETDPARRGARLQGRLHEG
jgi:hypothetical protein